MPPIIPGAPWWANLILLLVAVLVSSGATVLIAHMSTRRRLDDLVDTGGSVHDGKFSVQAQVDKHAAL